MKVWRECMQRQGWGGAEGRERRVKKGPRESAEPGDVKFCGVGRQTASRCGKAFPDSPELVIGFFH